VGGATALTDESNLADARESAACRCNIRLLKTQTPDKHVDVCVESDEDRGSTPLASTLAFGADCKSKGGLFLQMPGAARATDQCRFRDPK